MKRLIKILAVLALVLGAAFLIFRTPDTDAAEMRAKYGAQPSQFVTLPDGQEVHVRDEGPKDAPAIILLHGSAASLHTWEPWAAALSAQYRVISYDQIGHGLTGPSIDDDYSLDSFVADVDAVANALELDQFVLAGSSMGGWVSVGYALEHPERLKGLVLVGSSGSPVRHEERAGGSIGFTIASLPVLNNLMTQITPRSLIAQSLEQSVSVKSVASEEAVDRYWELLRYPGNRAATLKRFGTPRVTYSEEQMAAMQVPTLVMMGKEDALVPVEASRWYDANLPNSVLVEYAEIGHLPQEEAVDQSMTDLGQWLVNEPFKLDSP